MEVNQTQRANPRPARPVDPLATAAGLVVRRWRGKPRLSGEDKLAWGFLYARTFAGRQRVAVTPAEIGDDQGTTGDAGRQRIKNLVAARLLHVVEHDKERGVYIVELLDVPDGDEFLAVDGDPQHWFEFTDTAAPCVGPDEPHQNHLAGKPGHAAVLRLDVRRGSEDPPEEAPGDPRPASLLLDRESILTSPLNSLSSPAHSATKSEGAPGRGTAGGSSAAEDRVAEMLARQQPQSRLQEMQRLKDWILASVADRTLLPEAAECIAWDLVEGVLPTEREVAAIFTRMRQLREQHSLGSAAKFFNKSISRLYIRQGVPRQRSQRKVQR